jgi:hypothetical protein
VFCRHREHKNRVRQVLARYILQLSHAGVNFFASTLVPLESLPCLLCLLADIERKLRDGERDRARRLRVRPPLRVTFEY